MIDSASHSRIQGAMVRLAAQEGCVWPRRPLLHPASGADGELRVGIQFRGMRTPPAPGTFHSSEASDAAFEVCTRTSACCETPPGHL